VPPIKNSLIFFSFSVLFFFFFQHTCKATIKHVYVMYYRQIHSKGYRAHFGTNWIKAKSTELYTLGSRNKVHWWRTENDPYWHGWPVVHGWPAWGWSLFCFTLFVPSLYIGGSSMGHLGQMSPPSPPTHPFYLLPIPLHNSDKVPTELSEIKLYITQQVAR